MEISFELMGIRPDVKIVEKYVRETGNTFNDVETLEEVEKFSIWAVCQLAELPDESTPTPIEGESDSDKLFAELLQFLHDTKFDAAKAHNRLNISRATHLICKVKLEQKYRQWQATQQKNREEWISVETPPKKEGLYLAWVIKHSFLGPPKGAYVVYYGFGNDEDLTQMEWSFRMLPVELTHWMPLPKQPEQKNNPINEKL